MQIIQQPHLLQYQQVISNQFSDRNAYFNTPIQYRQISPGQLDNYTISHNQTIKRQNHFQSPFYQPQIIQSIGTLPVRQNHRIIHNNNIRNNSINSISLGKSLSPQSNFQYSQQYIQVAPKQLSHSDYQNKILNQQQSIQIKNQRVRSEKQNTQNSIYSTHNIHDQSIVNQSAQFEQKFKVIPMNIVKQNKGQVPQVHVKLIQLQNPQEQIFKYNNQQLQHQPSNQAPQIKLENPIILQEQKTNIFPEQQPIILQKQRPIIVQEQIPIIVQEQRPIFIQEQRPVIVHEQKSLIPEDEKPFFKIINPVEKPLIYQDKSPLVKIITQSPQIKKQLIYNGMPNVQHNQNQHQQQSQIFNQLQNQHNIGIIKPQILQQSYDLNQEILETMLTQQEIIVPKQTPKNRKKSTSGRKRSTPGRKKSTTGNKSNTSKKDQSKKSQSVSGKKPLKKRIQKKRQSSSKRKKSRSSSKKRVNKNKSSDQSHKIYSQLNTDDLLQDYQNQPNHQINQNVNLGIQSQKQQNIRNINTLSQDNLQKPQNQNNENYQYNFNPEIKSQKMNNHIKKLDSLMDQMHYVSQNKSLKQLNTEQIEEKQNKIEIQNPNSNIQLKNQQQQHYQNKLAYNSPSFSAQNELQLQNYKIKNFQMNYAEYSPEQNTNDDENKFQDHFINSPIQNLYNKNPDYILQKTEAETQQIQSEQQNTQEDQKDNMYFETLEPQDSMKISQLKTKKQLGFTRFNYLLKITPQEIDSNDIDRVETQPQIITENTQSQNDLEYQQDIEQKEYFLKNFDKMFSYFQQMQKNSQQDYNNFIQPEQEINRINDQNNRNEDHMEAFEINEPRTYQLDNRTTQKQKYQNNNINNIAFFTKSEQDIYDEIQNQQDQQQDYYNQQIQSKNNIQGRKNRQENITPSWQKRMTKQKKIEQIKDKNSISSQISLQNLKNARDNLINNTRSDCRQSGNKSKTISSPDSKSNYNNSFMNKNKLFIQHLEELKKVRDPYYDFEKSLSKNIKKMANNENQNNYLDKEEIYQSSLKDLQSLGYEIDKQNHFVRDQFSQNNKINNRNYK